MARPHRTSQRINQRISQRKNPQRTLRPEHEHERSEMNLKDLSALQIALGLSVLAHAALLTVRFVDPEAFNRVFSETPLEVILVNARSDEKPDKATAIAQ